MQNTQDCKKNLIFTHTKEKEGKKGPAMVLRLDGNSDHVVHAWRRIGIF